MNRTRKLLLLTAIAVGVQALAVWGTTSRRFFYGAVGPGSVLDDVRLYFRYASQARAGAVPYRDYVIEYPVAAFPVFFLPRLAAADFSRYKVVFGLEMLLVNAMAVFLVASWTAGREGMGRVPARLAWYTLFFGSLCPILIGRFDLAPMALTFASALLWFSGRSRLGGALGGAATLMKVYPGVLLIPAVVWELSRLKETRGRGVASFVLTTALGACLWFALGGEQVRDSLRYHGERGLEIGSLPAGLSILIGKLNGAALSTDFNHASTELVAPWSLRLARLSLPIQAGALLLVGWRFRRSGMTEPLRYAAAAILAFIAFGKVLSPQYLIWLFPFMAVLRGWTGSRSRWLFLYCCVLTTMIYPWAINKIVDFNGWAVGLLNYRNVLMVGLFGLLLFGPEAEPAPESGEAADNGLPAKTRPVLVP